MPRPVEPNEHDFESAFVQLRDQDWPASLRDLRQAASRYGAVLAAARCIANGGKVSRVGIDDALSPSGPSSTPRAETARAPFLRAATTTPAQWTSSAALRAIATTSDRASRPARFSASHPPHPS